MTHLLHSLPSPPQLLPSPSPSHLPSHPLPTLPSTLSRRSLAISTSSLLLPALLYPSPSLADTVDNACSNNSTTKNAFIDVSIDGVPAGRITIGLYANSGSSRFASLVSGSAGISYRRKEFIKIMPNYIQHAGVRSYGVDSELASRTGGPAVVADRLVAEWEAEKTLCPGIVKNVAGSVGIVVRDPAKPPPKVKLVAKKGKLEVEEEEVGVEPNGTEFVIVSRESPKLDESVLVVGRVVDGMEVVERMLKVKTVQENSSSPYFRVAKLIGDKRAVVAERGFNRPYSKVVVTNCGLIA